LHTIGEAARLSGLPVKTIRFYSDEGLLPPSGTTEAGYRLYSDRDLLRLDLIRTLRAVGFDLPTIRAMLEGKEGPGDAARLQLEALEVQIRGLKRQQSLLRTALGRRGDQDDGLLVYLKQAHALARLSAMEREGFVREHMIRGLSDVPIDPGWLDGLLKAAAANLPEEMSEEQLEAWLELADLVSDESFLKRLSDISRPFWESVQSGAFDMKAWGEASGRMYAAAHRAIEEGRAPDGEREQAEIEEYLQAHAKVMGIEDTDRVAAEMLRQYEEGREPRAERFWELVAILRGQDPSVMQVHAAAQRWLEDGLRVRVDGASNVKRQGGNRAG
jgi:DNA-binding transcriptional MerR regulator